MILDRAKLDGAAFWPPGPNDYLKTFGINASHELAKYDHVVFMEIPEERYFGGVHRTRFHNYRQSFESGEKLERLWSGHGKFIKIEAKTEFAKKIDHAVKVITEILFPKR